MASRNSHSWTIPAIRVAAAGFGAAVAGPLGGALGGWLGAALGGSAADLVEKYAEKFGDSAAEKLLEIGSDSLVGRLEEAAPDLKSTYREALRQSLEGVRGAAADGFDDWFANWDLCLAAAVPLDLPATRADQLVADKLDELFVRTLERLDAQGGAIRGKTLSLKLECRVLPEALLAELNNRLPKRFEEEIHALLVKPEYEQGWKQAQLIFQGAVDAAVRRIDEATERIDRRTELLPGMAEDLASLKEMAKGEPRKPRPSPIPDVSEHFVGREEDLQHILERLRRHRVVTVTGIGGMGKTEIAKAVAQAAAGQDWTADGVSYIDLQNATDASLVRGMIVSNLGLDAKEPIPKQIAGRRLYVLDDVYQAQVGDLKGIQELVRTLYDSAAPSHFLLTSRERLGVPGVESAFPLGRLQPPHDGDLFRSVADDLGYEWQSGDTERLTTLLEHLDGYPLAIMIGANWLGDARLEILLRRWENRHTEALNLPGISAGELSKMTSVDFSLALSFNHLPEGKTRTLFALFADLPAGASGETLEAILGDEVHEFLSHLVRSSLLQKQEDRYVVLVPVREFASKRRTEAVAALSQKLDARLIEFAEQWCDRPTVWNTPKRREACSVLSREEANIFAAVGRAKTRKDDEFLAKLVSALSPYLGVSRHDSGETLLDGAAAARATGQPQLEAECLRSLGDVYRGDDEKRELAEQRYEEALRIYESIGNQSGQAACIEGLGDLQMQIDEPDQAVARQRYEQAALLYQRQADKLGEANCIRKIAGLGEQNQAAIDRFKAAAAIFRDISDDLGEANCLRSAAEICLELDHSGEAQELIERALPLFRKVADKPREGNCLMLLGRLHHGAEDYASAVKIFEEARRVLSEVGDQVGDGFCRASNEDMRERIAEWINARTARADGAMFLGDAHAMLNDLERAKSFYLEALPLYGDTLDFRDGEAHCRYMLGMIFSYTDFASALAHYQEAIKLYARAGNRSKEAECRRKSGEMHLRLEESDQAWCCFEQALDLCSGDGDKSERAACLRGMGDVHVNRQQHTEAIKKYNEALQVFEAAGPSDDLAGACWGMGEACLGTGQRDDAVRWMEKSAEAYEAAEEPDQARQAREKAGEWRQDA
jgi:tetratricopeptide (TPR) repeat protein